MSAAFEPISSVKHPVLRRTRSLHTATGRAQSQQFLIEGEAMIRQALAAEAGIAETFFLDTAKVDPALAQSLAAAGANCYTVSRGLMTKVLGTGYDTSIAAVAVVAMHLTGVEALLQLEGPLLACERIQDPRNIGVLLRTGEAGGARGMVLSPDSADPFSRAAVRSSTGSILRLPLAVSQHFIRDLERLRAAGLRIIATSARGPTPLHKARLDPNCLLNLGNETEGLSPAAREVADDSVAIPMAGRASSFNVTEAAGILLYECMRSAPQED